MKNFTRLIAIKALIFIHFFGASVVHAQEGLCSWINGLSPNTIVFETEFVCVYGLEARPEILVSQQIFSVFDGVSEWSTMRIDLIAGRVEEFFWRPNERNPEGLQAYNHLAVTYSNPRYDDQFPIDARSGGPRRSTGDFGLHWDRGDGFPMEDIHQLELIVRYDYVPGESRLVVPGQELPDDLPPLRPASFSREAEIPLIYFQSEQERAAYTAAILEVSRAADPHNNPNAHQVPEGACEDVASMIQQLEVPQGDFALFGATCSDAGEGGASCVWDYSDYDDALENFITFGLTLDSCGFERLGMRSDDPMYTRDIDRIRSYVLEDMYLYSGLRSHTLRYRFSDGQYFDFSLDEDRPTLRFVLGLRWFREN